MIRFYLLPVEIAFNGWRGPKYLHWRHDPDPPGIPCRARINRDYGNEPVYLAAVDLTDEADAVLSAKPDVFRFPDNLDSPLGVDRVKIARELEAFNLPAHWLRGTHTHREVIRGIKGIFDLAQCLQGKGHRVFEAGVTMETSLRHANAEVHATILTCMGALGYDETGLTPDSTYREILAHVTHQAAPRAMLGVTL